MKKKLIAVLFGAVLILGACGGGGDTNTNDGNVNDGNNNVNNEASNNVDVSAAEEVYQNKCAGCHGDDLSGVSGPGLQEVGAKFSAEEIADIIENGKGSMPAINLDDADRDALAEWLAEKK